LPTLQAALSEDRADCKPHAGLGQRVQAWAVDAAAKVAGRIGDAAFDVAKDEAVKQITGLITRYLFGGA
jgi:hypothetical protein